MNADKCKSGYIPAGNDVFPDVSTLNLSHGKMVRSTYLRNKIKRELWACQCSDKVKHLFFIWESGVIYRQSLVKTPSYFDMHLEFAAPKCWSKYTTDSVADNKS